MHLGLCDLSVLCIIHLYLGLFSGHNDCWLGQAGEYNLYKNIVVKHIETDTSGPVSYVNSESQHHFCVA